METNTLYIIIGLLLAFNLYLYTKNDNNQGHMIEKNGMETQKQYVQQPQAEMVLFYSPGCGHCMSMKGEWNNFTNRNRDRLRIREVNCQTQDCGNVRGVPHIVLNLNGQEHVYQGRRTADDLESWINSF